MLCCSPGMLRRFVLAVPSAAEESKLGLGQVATPVDSTDVQTQEAVLDLLCAGAGLCCRALRSLEFEGVPPCTEFM